MNNDEYKKYYETFSMGEHIEKYKRGDPDALAWKRLIGKAKKAKAPNAHSKKRQR